MSDMGKQFDVVIKVSSLAVHNTLIEPDATNGAFRGLECKALSDVLIGVWRPSPSSLVTIMKDLRKDYYQSLEPWKIPNVSSLWNSFAKLVQELLLPLARHDVVHCDIRPGWDHTANLMLKKNVRVGIQLRLIDYESLCIIQDARMVPVDERCFHIEFSSNPDERTNAFVFLWWQCVVVAYAWHHKLISAELNAIKLLDDCFSGKLGACFKDCLDEVDVPFLQDCAISKIIMESMVTKTLQIFGDCFKMTAS